MQSQHRVSQTTSHVSVNCNIRRQDVEFSADQHNWLLVFCQFCFRDHCVQRVVKQIFPVRRFPGVTQEFHSWWSVQLFLFDHNGKKNSTNYAFHKRCQLSPQIAQLTFSIHDQFSSSSRIALRHEESSPTPQHPSSIIERHRRKVVNGVTRDLVRAHGPNRRCTWTHCRDPQRRKESPLLLYELLLTPHQNVVNPICQYPSSWDNDPDHAGYEPQVSNIQSHREQAFCFRAFLGINRKQALPGKHTFALKLMRPCQSARISRGLLENTFQENSETRLAPVEYSEQKMWEGRYWPKGQTPHSQKRTGGLSPNRST